MLWILLHLNGIISNNIPYFFACDVGDWSIELTNTDGKEFYF